MMDELMERLWHCQGMAPAPIPARQGSIRAANMALVYRLILDSPTPPSRAALAAATGMTRATAGALVDALLAGGLVAEVSPPPAVGAGRPASGVVPAPTGPAGLGLEVNVDYLAACVVDLTGRVRHRVTVAGDQRGRDAAEVLRELAEVGRRAASEVAGLVVAGVAVAVPGLVGVAGSGGGVAGLAVGTAGSVAGAGSAAGSGLVAGLGLMAGAGSAAGANSADGAAGLVAEAGLAIGAAGSAAGPGSAAGLGSVAGAGSAAGARAAAGAGSTVGVASAGRGAASAVGAPGLVLRAPNLGWRDVDVASLLAGELPETPMPLSVGNEADFAALAELDADRDLRDFLYISGEIGVGAGIVFDRRLFTGARGWAGEIGHVTVEPDGAQCRCGARGCLETVAGLESLADVKRAGSGLGRAIAATVNLLDVGTVVLGGVYAARPEIVPVVRMALEEHVVSAEWAPVMVRTSSVGEAAAAVGAAASVVHRIHADPAGWDAR